MITTRKIKSDNIVKNTYVDKSDIPEPLDTGSKSELKRK